MGTIIGMLGLSYFVIYLLMFLMFHFPSSQHSIPYAPAVMAFGGGISIWYLCVVFQNGFSAFYKQKMTKEQSSIWFVGLFLVWTAAFPTIAFLFPAQPLLQLGYASAFTVIAPLHAPSPLAAAFGRLVLINLFGCALYALRPLERIGMAQSWKPSLHGMYLVLTYSLVAYSKAVMQVAIPYMS
ncbi:unnamed protein product [Penicillium nalgiovense]|nr:unnamed protein product [Penicillium nalgiovense]